MMNAPVPHDALSHGGKSQEKLDESGWKVAPFDERDLWYLKRREESGMWDPVLTARALERFRPEPGEKVVIIGRGQLAGPPGAGYLSLFAAVRDAATPGWYLKGMDEPHPELAVMEPCMPTPDKLREFLHRNSHEAGYMQAWSVTGEVPYVELDGNADMGVVTIGAMNAQAGTRAETPCRLPATYP